VKQLTAGKSAVSQAAAKIARNAIDHNRSQGFLIGPNMHDSLAVTAFLDPSILTFENYYVDVEVNGELTAGQTLGYSPNQGDLRRSAEMQKKAESTMVIRGAAPTLAGTKISPVLRDKWVPNTRVALNLDPGRFFNLLIGRLSS
jgi:inosine-uridine nucleoside N-ribohydrolase